MQKAHTLINGLNQKSVLCLNIRPYAGYVFFSDEGAKPRVILGHRHFFAAYRRLWTLFWKGVFDTKTVFSPKTGIFDLKTAFLTLILVFFYTKTLFSDRITLFGDTFPPIMTLHPQCLVAQFRPKQTRILILDVIILLLDPP